MSSSTEPLVKAYAQAMQNQLLGGNACPPGAKFYINAMSDAAIPIGVEAVTNRQIFHAADQLQDPKSPLWQPADASYIDRLTQYMRSVQLQANPQRGYQEELTKAVDEATKAGDKFLVIDDAAYDKYSKHREAKNMTFENWVDMYYKQWRTARSSVDGANQKVSQIQSTVSGPNYQTLQEKLDQLAGARDRLKPYSGLNMPTTMKDVTSATELNPQIDVSYRPLYGIPDYKATVENWRATFGTAGEATKTIKFSLSQGNSLSWADVGQSNASWAAGTYCPFISLQGSGSTSDSHTDLSFNSQSDKIDCVITLVGYNMFDVKTGDWDVSEPRQGYSAHLLPAAEKDFAERPLVKIQRLMIGYGVGIKISFSKHIYQQVQSMSQSASQSQASLRIWCWNFSSSSSSSSSSRSLNSIKFDDQAGCITIPPANDNKPVLLGAIGRIMS